MDKETEGSYAVAWSSDSTYLATSSNDGRPDTLTSHVDIWRVGDGTLFRTLDDFPEGYGVVNLAWRHDGAVLALALEQPHKPFGGLQPQGVGFIQVFDVQSWQILQTFHGHEQRINALVFSPDGRWLLSGGYDGMIRTWDARSVGSTIGLHTPGLSP